MTLSNRIFFGAAIQGAADRSLRAHVNLDIIEAIKTFGYDVISEHTTGLDFNDTADKLETAIGPLPPIGKLRTEFIRNTMIRFIESDICAAVFEVSTPSLGTGIEIAHAYLRPRMGLPTVPVIALYQNGFWPNHLSAMIKGISHETVPQFHVIEYKTSQEIPDLLAPLFDILNRNDTIKASGRIAARKCASCGHHEIGIETDTGAYLPLKPGMGVKLI